MNKKLRIKLIELWAVASNEYRCIFRDPGVLLVVVGAIVIYSGIYAIAYRNEVLRDIPVAVVDNNKTAASRELIRTFDATPNLRVDYKAPDLKEAKELLLRRKVSGIIVIPSDFEKKINIGRMVNITVYADASYFLVYRQVFNDVLSAMLRRNNEIMVDRFEAKGLGTARAEFMAEPVRAKVTNLYNPYVGYATFVVPVILIVILQQTLLIGIGMVGGTWREQNLYGKLVTKGNRQLSVMPLVLGRALAYGTISVVTVVYLFEVLYRWCHYPANGSTATLILFLTPYILSCIFLGIAISTLFKSRENSLLAMLFTSIPFVMLTGASLPKEAIPVWLFNLGKIIPSSSGVDGFISIQTMGASLSEVSTSWRILWILTAVYFALACIGTRAVINKTRDK